VSGAPAGIGQGLRMRAADALERGLGFVDAHARCHGDAPIAALAPLFARVLLGAAPAAEALERVAQQRRADGSFAPLGLTAAGAPGFETLSTPVVGVLESLVVSADLGGLRGPVADATARYCEQIQLADGSWGDPVAPGEPSGRIFATGMIAGLLGRSPAVRPHLFERAGRFLGELWAPERVEGGNWPALAAFGTFFSNVPHDLADEAMQWCGRELERGFLTGRFEASACVRVLLHCDALALPGSGLAPSALLARLLDEQAADGGFAELAAGGPAARIVPSLDAMHGIIRLCQAP